MRWEIYFFVCKSLANGKGSINIFCFVILLSKKCEHSLEWVGYGRMALWNFDETTRFAWMWCHLIQFNLHEIFETRKSKHIVLHLNSLQYAVLVYDFVSFGTLNSTDIYTSRIFLTILTLTRTLFSRISLLFKWYFIVYFSASYRAFYSF